MRRCCLPRANVADTSGYYLFRIRQKGLGSALLAAVKRVEKPSLGRPGARGACAMVRRWRQGGGVPALAAMSNGLAAVVGLGGVF